MLARIVCGVRQSLFGCLCGGVSVLLVVAVLSHLRDPDPLVWTALAPESSEQPLVGERIAESAPEDRGGIDSGPLAVTPVSLYHDIMPAVIGEREDECVETSAACVYSAEAVDDDDAQARDDSSPETCRDLEATASVYEEAGGPLAEATPAAESAIDIAAEPANELESIDTLADTAVDAQVAETEQTGVAEGAVEPQHAIVAPTVPSRVDDLDRVCSIRGAAGNEVVATIRMSGQVTSTSLSAGDDASGAPAVSSSEAMSAAECPTTVAKTAATPMTRATPMAVSQSSTEPRVVDLAEPSASPSLPNGGFARVRFDESMDDEAPAAPVASSPQAAWQVVEPEQAVAAEAPAVPPGAVSPTIGAGELQVARQARALIAEGSLGATIDVLTAGVTQHPQSAMLFRMLGEAYIWREDYQAASRALERSIALDKMDPLTNSLFAEALMKLGKQSRADHYYRQAIEVSSRR